MCARFNRVQILIAEETTRRNAKLQIADLNEDENERAPREELKTGRERKDERRVDGRLEAWPGW